MSARHWFLVMALLGPGTALSYTGNELLAQCRSPEIAQARFCLGFVAGYASGYNTGVMEGIYLSNPRTTLGELTPKLHALRPYCMPEEVTAGQMRDIVVKWLEENPKERHKEVWILIPMAVTSAYPCRQHSDMSQ
jgi:hypothetical protein